MKITTVLFDLDGTLLPMDQEVFVKTYFGRIARYLAPHGYDPDAIIKAIWTGTGAMIKNDGSKTNEQAFWDRFCQIFGEGARADESIFERFYIEDFDNVSVSCGYDARAAKAIAEIKAAGFRTALATNPIFPAIATRKRMRWAGLDEKDFELFTTYENSRFCKPSPDYYRDVMAALGVKPEECVMVGNDVSDDMVCTELGMKVFLLTDNLINKDNVDVSVYPNGSFEQLVDFIRSL